MEFTERNLEKIYFVVVEGSIEAEIELSLDYFFIG